MNQHQNSEQRHTTSKMNSFHFEDAYVNLAYENNSNSPDDTQQNSDDPQMDKIQELGSVLTDNGIMYCRVRIKQPNMSTSFRSWWPLKKNLKSKDS